VHKQQPLAALSNGRRSAAQMRLSELASGLAKRQEKRAGWLAKLRLTSAPKAAGAKRTARKLRAT